MECDFIPHHPSNLITSLPPSRTMEPLRQAPDPGHLVHLQDACRVLALPRHANGLRWHPFGVYVVPLPRRVVDGAAWSRRLHVWHPSGTPVGEASPYGVHTHTGTARSHVLAGSLQHHLYDFVADGEGVWQERSEAGTRRTRLQAHVRGVTRAGMVHTLPAHQAHSVGKGADFAVSLFEQVEEGRARPFTTWQRVDVPAEALVRQAPADLDQVLRDARAVVEQALYAVTG